MKFKSKKQRFISGYYVPRNKEKFIYSNSGLNEKQSEIKLPRYRSSYELKFMRFCDFNSEISKWSSEPFPIKYFHPIKKKICNYYVDFLIIIKGIKYLIEIKPENQTKLGKSDYNNAQVLVNEAKWNAAREFCLQNNMKFLIITEKTLKI
jgi:possible phage head completion protein